MEPDQVSSGIQNGHLADLSGPHQIEDFGSAGGLVHGQKIVLHGGIQALTVECLAGEQRATNIAVCDRPQDATGGIADECDTAAPIVDRSETIEQRRVRANDELLEASVHDLFHSGRPELSTTCGITRAPDATSDVTMTPIPTNESVPTVRWSRITAPSPRKALSPTKADRKSTRLNSSHSQISYAVFCLKQKTQLQPVPL